MRSQVVLGWCKEFCERVNGSGDPDAVLQARAADGVVTVHLGAPSPHPTLLHRKKNGERFDQLQTPARLTFECRADAQVAAVYVPPSLVEQGNVQEPSRETLALWGAPSEVDEESVRETLVGFLGRAARHDWPGQAYKDQEVLPSEAQPLSRQHDWFLESFVQLANGSNLSVSITLTVGGSTVTGVLCGGLEYFRGISGLLGEGFDPVTNVGEAMYGPGTVRGPATYIHLKDARICAPGGEATPSRDQPGVYWRGRLSEVSGFLFGSISAKRG